MKEKLRDLIPSKVFYLWERYGFKRIELFTQEDVEKKPEIPEAGGWVKKLHEKHLTEEERRRRKHHG